MPEIVCGNGHINSVENKFCNSCGEKLTIPCPQCKAENIKTVDFCGDCGASLKSRIQSEDSGKIETGGGNTIGDVGLIKNSTISSTTNIHKEVVHGGHGLNGSFNPIFNIGNEHKHVTKTGEKCPICRKLVKDDYFDCTNCGRDFICLSHRHDTKPYFCEDCIEKLDKAIKSDRDDQEGYGKKLTEANARILASEESLHGRKPTHQIKTTIYGGILATDCYGLTSKDENSSAHPLLQSCVGRNDPCPCGSGLKYKKCCGK